MNDLFILVLHREPGFGCEEPRADSQQFASAAPSRPDHQPVKISHRKLEEPSECIADFPTRNG